MEMQKFDFSPARWIWVPSQRTLPNTFALFKRDFFIKGETESVKGYVTACSRYLFTFNGMRIQSGPAPCDPRFEEADGFDLTDIIKQGKNTLGFRVLYFAYGDGTWVAGRPGLIFKLEIKYKDGTAEEIFSDENTLAVFDKSHTAGQYKRWFLRALQEVYDARLDIFGFDIPEFCDDHLFVKAMVLPGPSDKPSSLNGYNDYLFDSIPCDSKNAYIRKRNIPMPKEDFVSAELYHCGTVKWNADPDDWFKFRSPGSFEIEEGLKILTNGGDFSFEMPDVAAYLTFKMPEQGCGYIDFELEAPEGTIVEAMVQESHNKEKTLWLDSNFYCWTRFICKEGSNRFVSYDTESFMYLQLHIRNAKGGITVKNPGMLRRTYPAKNPPVLYTDNKKLMKLFDASVNTLKNSIIETATDGMARERQQYAGDCCHQVMAFSYLYGANEPVVRRYYETFSDGATLDGYYMDCWPAYDRFLRISQVQIGITNWPPILDHVFQFILDTWQYYKHSGDNYIIEKCFKDFLRFYDFTKTMIDEDGLLKVENMGKVSVWIDHETFKKQRDKRCVFNLYFVATIKAALLPMCEFFNENERKDELLKTAENIFTATVKRYYDSGRKIFTDNLPYVNEDGYTVTSDRTLATALLYGLFPETPDAMVKCLVDMPEFVTKSYPCNVVWTHRALAKYGEVDAITKDFELRWFNMPSVQINNTLQEFFKTETDGYSEMSHCPLSPAIAPYEYYGGLICEDLGFSEFSLRPQLGKIMKLKWIARTVNGDISFNYDSGNLIVTFNKNMKGYIIDNRGNKNIIISGKIMKI